MHPPTRNLELKVAIRIIRVKGLGLRVFIPFGKFRFSWGVCRVSCNVSFEGASQGSRGALAYTWLVVPGVRIVLGNPRPCLEDHGT